ncbi:MAG: AMP-binding protein [Candidatus Latescibacteria bacterium]|nr:AMP-binding protein [Candidatus Latescibacterota bacterium]
MPDVVDPESAEALQQDALWATFVSEQQGGTRQEFNEHWLAFQRIFANRNAEDGPPIVWRPDEETVTATNLHQALIDTGFSCYRDLHAWSVQNKSGFWEYVIDRLGILFETPPARILDLSEGCKHPTWFPGAVMNIADSCFTAHRDKPAILSRGEDVPEAAVTTYGELEELVNRFANGLTERGIAPDTAIALYMPMTVACVAAYLGIIRAGCRVVSIADSFSAEELRTRMEIASADTVLTVESYRRSGKDIAMYNKVISAGIEAAIVIPADEGNLPSLRDSDVLWDDFLSAREIFVSVTREPECITNILFSSGTTGEPKAIPWTHLTPLKGAMDGHFHQDIHGNDVVAWPTNIGWMMGPWLIYATFINGATMALYEGAPLGEDFTAFVRDARVSVLGVVPSIVRTWRNQGALDHVEWPNIRVVTSTGEPSNREDYLWLMSRMAYRTPIIEYLGGTEIGGGHLACTLVQPASPSTFTTAGLGIEVVVLDEDDLPVTEGQMGELFLIPPAIGLSQSLLNKDHDSVYYDDCPKGPNGEILRRHGDQTLRMHRGFYRAQGRADDTMNLGGIKVSSLELEQIIDSHPGVYESAAIGFQPGGEGAERLVVFVVTHQSVGLDELGSELSRMIGKRLNPLYKIHRLVPAQALPRTASNKLMRRTLRAEYMESRDS